MCSPCSGSFSAAAETTPSLFPTTGTAVDDALGVAWLSGGAGGAAELGLVGLASAAGGAAGRVCASAALGAACSASKMSSGPLLPTLLIEKTHLLTRKTYLASRSI